MDRRDFIKSVGAASMFSLLGSVVVQASTQSPEPRHSSTLKGPFDIACDATGNLLVTDPAQYRVLRLDSRLNPVSSFGGPGSQKGRLNFPMGLAVDPKGLVYVVDANNCRVQVFDDRGAVSRVLGSVGCIAGCFATPQGLCLDKDGKILVADTRNHRVQIFRDGKLIGGYRRTGRQTQRISSSHCGCRE